MFPKYHKANRFDICTVNVGFVNELSENNISHSATLKLLENIITIKCDPIHKFESESAIKLWWEKTNGIILMTVLK